MVRMRKEMENNMRRRGGAESLLLTSGRDTSWRGKNLAQIATGMKTDPIYFVTQDDEINRRVFDPSHRSFIPNFGCYIKVEEKKAFTYYALTRQMVLSRPTLVQHAPRECWRSPDRR